MKQNIKLYALMIVLSVVFAAGSLFAQEFVGKGELESILGRFSNYRYGTVTIWKFKNDDRDIIREAIKDHQQSADGTQSSSADALTNVDNRIIKKTEDGVRAGMGTDDILEDIEMSFQDVTLPSAAEFDRIYNAVRDQIFGGSGQKPIKTVYLVTTRATEDHKGTIIATIVSTQDDYIEINLESPTSQDIYVAEEMKLITITNDKDPTVTNLFEIAERRLSQGNLINATLDAQGIGNINWFGQRNFGKTVSLFKNEWDLTPEDIQSVIKISEKQPEDQYLKENELVVSMDLISWKNYQTQYYDDGAGNFVLDTYFIVNSRLPRYGMELKYGINEINYPSLWSERMTLSAVWDRVKLGVILPTTGWSPIAESWFSQTRKLTGGGFGVSAEMDFPFKVIPKSGVFRGSIAYVFGDAKRFFNKDATLDEFSKFEKTSDYMIRFNSQLHYTFAIAIDQDYLFRFGIGGTVYTAERWMNFIDSTNINEGELKLGFHEIESKTIGGVSGRIDFMAKNIMTPYGASMQYFDEGIGMNAWLQLPIMANTFSVRLEANGYYKAFKDNPRPWENRSVFIPTARFIVFF